MLAKIKSTFAFISPIIFSLLGSAGCGNSALGGDNIGNAYGFNFISIDGRSLPFSQFKGKVVLVVNTASRCGFTSQYEGLVQLWQKYREKGFVVLAIPSNDFGGQEPGNSSEIKNFCEVTFGVDFPMSEKISVTGPDAHPFYKWAASEFGWIAKPRWNFHKYLVGADGQLVDWFSSVTKPSSNRLIKAIEAQLALDKNG